MGPEEKERPFVKRKSISVLFFKEESLFKEKGEEYLEDGIPHISMEHLS